MAVIALVGNKGGAGKTTLCINLAAALSGQDQVVILDADPQQSSMQWRDIAEGNSGLTVISAVNGIKAALDLIDTTSRYYFIDCPPSVHSQQMQEALRLADLAIIPVQPSPLDIWATVHIENEVETARQDNPSLRAVMVINQLEPRTRLSQLMRLALVELSLPAAETAIRRRAAYRNSFLEGRTVHDQGSRGASASDEIHKLIREMENIL